MAQTGQTKNRRGDGPRQGGDVVDVGGDVHGSLVNGTLVGATVGGSNHGSITIYAAGGHEPNAPTMAVVGLRRVPVPVSVIGVTSGILTIAGAVTGYQSVGELVDALTHPTGPATGPWGLPVVLWWVAATIVFLLLASRGLSQVRFLRRHVLRLPRQWWRRARAGVRMPDGRTYPCSLRLRGECPICGGRLRFRDGAVVRRMPDGTLVRRDGPRGECTRNEVHWLPIDVAKNDFDGVGPTVPG